jgi:hypothetical protein
MIPMPRYRIAYKPNAPQRVFHDACNKAASTGSTGFVSFVAGMATGKTFAGAQQAIKTARMNPGVPGAVVTLSYPLAEAPSGAIDHTVAILEKAKIRHKYKEGKHQLYIYDTDSKIQFLSSEIPKKIISASYGWMWCDEPGTFKTEVLGRAVTRFRDIKSKYPLMFCTGTPEGYNQFYNFAIKKSPPNHMLIRGRTQDNEHHLLPGYIDNLKSQFDPQLLKAYLNGEFVNLTSGAVYYAYERDAHQKRIDFDPARDVYLSCDFNVNPMAWNIYQVYTAREMNAKYPTMRFQDQVLVCPSECEISMRQADTAGAAMRVADKLKAFGWRGGTLRLYGDATGKNKSTKSHRSDYDILQAVLKEQMQGLDISYNVPLGQPSQRDSINAVNGRLRNGKGEVGLLIDPSNVNLNDDLEQVVYDKSGGIDKSMETGSNPRVHWQDNLRYLVHRAFPAIIHRTTSRTY